MKFLTRCNPGILVAIVVAILCGYAFICFATLDRPRGLIIQAPQSGPGNSAAAGNSAADTLTFAKIDPVVFAGAFGLEYQRKKPEPIEKPAVIEKTPEPVVEKPEEKGPTILDLAASGYRLKGIILEKDGNSAAFVYDPTSKKTLVVREKSNEPLRIISATMRSIRLQTPEGEGFLNLEEPAGKKGMGSMAVPSGSTGYSRHSDAAAADSQPAATKMNEKIAKKEKLLRQTETSSNSVLENISAGHFFVKPERGVYQVEVRRVPDAFLGYGLQPGDKIVGTSAGNFRQSQDVTNRLGRLSEQPTPLKIQRGRRTMYLNPPKAKQPPPDQPVDEKKPGQSPFRPPANQPIPRAN